MRELPDPRHQDPPQQASSRPRELSGAGVDLHTNGTSLLTDKFERRAVATWESALRELLEKGLLIARGESGEIYEITKHGYDVAERL